MERVGGGELSFSFGARGRGCGGGSVGVSVDGGGGGWEGEERACRRRTSHTVIEGREFEMEVSAAAAAKTRGGEKRGEGWKIMFE